MKQRKQLLVGYYHYGVILTYLSVAAAIVGIDNRVGSLTVGKDADLVLFSEDPLTVAAKPLGVMVDGQWIKDPTV